MSPIGSSRVFPQGLQADAIKVPLITSRSLPPTIFQIHYCLVKSLEDVTKYYENLKTSFNVQQKFA
jgi:hypothetical protein